MRPGQAVRLDHVIASPSYVDRVEWRTQERLAGLYLVEDYVVDERGSTLFVSDPDSNDGFAVNLDRDGDETRIHVARRFLRQ